MQLGTGAACELELNTTVVRGEEGRAGGDSSEELDVVVVVFGVELAAV